MLSESFNQYRNRAKWCIYGYHKVAFWDTESNAQASEQRQVEGSANTKEVIVFLHGFPSASWDWHFQWQILKENYRCIAFDMLGFGLSDKPRPHQYSVLEQADIALYLCQKLGVRKAHIVAHDYGVSVAQELLARQHQRIPSVDISSICFLNGGLFAETHRPLFTQKLLHSIFGPIMVRLMTKVTLKQSFIKIFGKQSPPAPHEIDTLWRLLKFKEGNLVLPSLLDYLDERVLYRDRWVKSMQSTKVPLAFVNGVQDPISGNHMLNRFKELLPDSAVQALEVGHYPQLEAKQAVTDLIRQFVSTRRLS
ncbi:alpha/beta fold hydrolase [Glaciecola sp. SC05]|uniref:alpha/beta fold hydrolase n=1 Tax=Glaciecola sp. SC05 TaxID=1987355 RepID=UPI003528C25E